MSLSYTCTSTVPHVLLTPWVSSLAMFEIVTVAVLFDVEIDASQSGCPPSMRSYSTFVTFLPSR